MPVRGGNIALVEQKKWISCGFALFELFDGGLIDAAIGLQNAIEP